MTHWPTSGTLSTILRGEGVAVLMMAQQGSWDWPAPQEISLGCEPGTEVGDRLPPRFPQPPAKPGEASLERSAPLWNKHTDEQDQCQGRSPKGPSTEGSSGSCQEPPPCSSCSSCSVSASGTFCGPACSSLLEMGEQAENSEITAPSIQTQAPHRRHVHGLGEKPSPAPWPVRDAHPPRAMGLSVTWEGRDSFIGLTEAPGLPLGGGGATETTAPRTAHVT